MTVQVTTQAARLYLLAGIRSYFQANGVKWNVVYGFRERTKQNQEGVEGAGRICLVPGRVPNGDDGTFDRPVGPGGNPRKLVSQELLVTLVLWAAAAADNQNEEQTEQAIDDMKRDVISAVQSTLMHAVTWNSNRFNPNPNEVRFGVEYLIELSISGSYEALEQGVIATPTPVVNRGSVTLQGTP